MDLVVLLVLHVVQFVWRQVFYPKKVYPHVETITNMFSTIFDSAEGHERTRTTTHDGVLPNCTAADGVAVHVVRCQRTTNHHRGRREGDSAGVSKTFRRCCLGVVHDCVAAAACVYVL